VNLIKKKKHFNRFIYTFEQLVNVHFMYKILKVKTKKEHEINIYFEIK